MCRVVPDPITSTDPWSSSRAGASPLAASVPCGGGWGSGGERPFDLRVSQRYHQCAPGQTSGDQNHKLSADFRLLGVSRAGPCPLARGYDGLVIRLAVTYHGRVQGVGFRATSRHLASKRDVVGWVRNQPDGSVRLEAQGAPAEVDGLLEDIQRTLGHLVSSADRTPIQTSDELSFDIRY